MTKHTVNILLVSHDKKDAIMLQQLLKATAETAIALKIRNAQDNEKAFSDLYQYDGVLTTVSEDLESSILRIKHCTGLHQAPPLIALTHKDSPAIYQMALNAGAADCVSFAHLSCELLEHCISHAIRQKFDGKRLLQLALYDPLTGLANRSLMHDKLTEQIAQSQRSNQQFAVLVIDLDNFKWINEQYGHDEGDEYLVCMAERIANCIRETDTAARIDGNRFAIMATQLHCIEDSAIIAEAILESCQLSLEKNFQPFTLQCSVGIALFPHDSQQASGLLQKANLAMQQAKVQGGGSYCYVDSELNKSNQHRQKLLDGIGHALLRKQFKLLYQPIISVADELIGRVEVLIRWQHPTEGLLMPDQFLPMAESSGIIHALGNWILNTAFQQHRPRRIAAK